MQLKVEAQNTENIFADLKEFYLFEIAEDRPIGSVVGSLSDATVSSVSRSYLFQDFVVSKDFNIDESTGDLSTAVNLDYEMVKIVYYICNFKMLYCTDKIFF